MKRIYLLLVILFATFTAYSQINYRFIWGVSINDYTHNGYGTRLGYKFGPGIEFRKQDSNFSYGFDLLLISKGTSSSELSMEQKYIQVPAHVNLNFPLSKKMDIVWTNSFYLAYGFAGKSKRVENGRAWITSTYNDDNVWGKKVPRFDLGFDTGITLDFGRFLTGISFEIGCFPLQSEKVYYNTGKGYEWTLNKSIFLTFAVRFW